VIKTVVDIRLFPQVIAHSLTAGGGPDDLASPQYCHRLELRPHFFWMTTRRRRNLEMPGNVTALGQMSGIDKVRKIVGKKTVYCSLKVRGYTSVNVPVHFNSPRHMLDVS